jgi:hypothetical protein
MEMTNKTSSEHAMETPDATMEMELSVADVVRECGAVLPHRKLMRIKLPGKTFYPDPSSFDPQLAAADPFYVPRGHFGL